LKSVLRPLAHGLLASATDLLLHHPKRISATVAALLLTGTGFTFAVANLAPDAAQLPVRSLVESLDTPALHTQALVLQAQTLNLYRSDSTRATDTAETLLKRLGVFDPQAAAFVRSDALAQRNILGRAGRAVSAEASSSNGLLKLQARWSADEDGMFKRLSIEKTATGFISRLETLPLTASTRMASGTITSTLFAATDAARIPDSVSGQLAEIFAGDIDFHRALRKEDRFSVVYETLEGDGEPLRAGRLLSAEFVNGGKAYQAMWFQDPSHATAAGSSARAPAKGAYYTLAGESLKRAFLASPMEFSRVTSGFKMRFHPILQVWKAHLGVDYAAPIGTPVRGVGDGVVEFAGVQSGFGNVVKIKHQNQISTVYAHLSRISVRTGQSVAQGQNLGLVGMTGWSTGPHLHFEYRVGGVYHDPQTIARRNETVPLTASLRPMFDRAAAQARVALAAAGQLQFSSVE
jgi:murein DD-endopeptidase MepM/ murein hydrolase activator NlpD